MNKIPSNPFWKKACYWVQAHPACPPLEETGLADLVTSLVTSSSRTYFLLLLLKHFEFNLLTDGLYLDKYNALSSVQFSSVVSDSLRPHGPQDTRPPSLSITNSNSCLPSWWFHPTISSFVIPFSSCLQSFPLSGSFLVSQFFASGGPSIGVSASVSVLPMNIQDWFPLGWISWTSLQSKGLSRVFSNTTVQKHQFFGAQLSL